MTFINYNIRLAKPKQRSSQKHYELEAEGKNEEEYHLGADSDNSDEFECDNDLELDSNHLAVEELYKSESDDENKMDQSASHSHSPHLQDPEID
ncbi:hypothetical protein V9T40_006957 [Parthenolecanium corni]|uniref:Uncharacterized protein n=1 Tax=Parthenolecanium corni TaxID=536013 RepID=A0AAN9U310_9HEMI